MCLYKGLDAYSCLRVDRDTIINQGPNHQLQCLQVTQKKNLADVWRCILEPNAGLIISMKQGNDLLDVRTLSLLLSRCAHFQVCATYRYYRGTTPVQWDMHVTRQTHWNVVEMLITGRIRSHCECNGRNGSLGRGTRAPRAPKCLR